MDLDLSDALVALIMQIVWILRAEYARRYAQRRALEAPCDCADCRRERHHVENDPSGTAGPNGSQPGD
jgi:hypothetical protein